MGLGLGLGLELRGRGRRRGRVGRGPGWCGLALVEPNFLLLRLVLDLNLGFVTGTWVGLETDGLGGSAGAGLGWAGLGWGGDRSFATGT